MRDGDSLGPPLFSTDIVSSASSAVRNPTRKDPVQTPAGNSAALDPTAPLREARADFEARHIANALARNNGNVSHTATALGISRVALQKKMKGLGLRQV